MCAYLQVIVAVILYINLAGWGTECFDLDKQPGYKEFLADLTQKVNWDSKKFMTDHGYGSRLRAGKNFADAVTAYGHVYGAYGPGKRSTALAKTDFDIASDEEEINFLEVPELSKRYISDHGTDARQRSTGKNIARGKLIKDVIYGAVGPGRRSRFLRIGKSGGFGDAGYLSRIDAAKNLAYDDECRKKIFGSMGPGRRR